MRAVTTPHTLVGWTWVGRHGRPRPCAIAVAVLAVVTGLTPAGCTDQSEVARDPDATVRDLGAVPIPSPPTAQATPLADEGHLQLLAIGAPVRVALPESSGVVVASGPTEDLPTAGPVPDRVTGAITITINQVTAPLTVAATDFTSRDEQGTPVALTPAGPAAVTATADHPGALILTGSFGSGAAQITWRHHGNVVAIWDFNIELD